jgi:hypothetical protein
LQELGDTMPTTKRTILMDRLASMPEQLLDEVEEALDGIEELYRASAYPASPDELAAIDEARSQFARGEVATDEEVEAAFAKFRGS